MRVYRENFETRRSPVIFLCSNWLINDIFAKIKNKSLFSISSVIGTVLLLDLIGLRSVSRASDERLAEDGR